MCKRALARLPVVIPIWFLAIIFPFFGPINSTVGSLLVSFTVYMIPALAHMFVYIIPAFAHMFTFRSPSARENAVERPPWFVGRWAGAYAINAFVVVWVLVVGFGFGGWASLTNFVHQVDTFGLFTKCYQCPTPHPSLVQTLLLLSLPLLLLKLPTTRCTIPTALEGGVPLSKWEGELSKVVKAA